MHWETKIHMLALLQYLLYCGGLEQNPLYLRSLPLYTLDQEFVSLMNMIMEKYFE